MAKDIKQLSDTDLEKKLSELRAQVRDLDLGRKAPAHPKERRTVRKDIARVMTELGARMKVSK